MADSRMMIEEIMSMRQTGTASDYCNRFQEWFKRVQISKGFSEFYGIYLFIWGLEPKIGDVFDTWHQYSCNRVEDVISLALKIDANDLRDSFSPFDPESSFYKKELEWDTTITLDELMKDNDFFRNGKIQETITNEVIDETDLEIKGEQRVDVKDSEDKSEKINEYKVFDEMSNQIRDQIEAQFSDIHICETNLGEKSEREILIQELQQHKKDSGLSVFRHYKNETSDLTPDVLMDYDSFGDVVCFGDFWGQKFLKTGVLDITSFGWKPGWLYSITNIENVTLLKDGMNLCSYEFLGCQDNSRRVGSSSRSIKTMQLFCAIESFGWKPGWISLVVRISIHQGFVNGTDHLCMCLENTYTKEVSILDRIKTVFARCSIWGIEVIWSRLGKCTIWLRFDVGNFRREQNKDITLQELTVEIQAALQLEKLREDEIQGLKMRLKVGEVAIKKIDIVVSAEISVETRLLTKKKELLKALEVLHSQVEDVRTNALKLIFIVLNRDGLSLKIEVAEVAAFVGVSGSGNSTLIRMLQKFYERTLGSVKVDDVDIIWYNNKAIRSFIAWVGQGLGLLAESVKEKIACTKKNAPEFEIIQAACFANVNGLKDGYDMGYGEISTQLSFEYTRDPEYKMMRKMKSLGKMRSGNRNRGDHSSHKELTEYGTSGSNGWVRKSLADIPGDGEADVVAPLWNDGVQNPLSRIGLVVISLAQSLIYLSGSSKFHIMTLMEKLGGSGETSFQSDLKLFDQNPLYDHREVIFSSAMSTCDLGGVMETIQKCKEFQEAGVKAVNLPLALDFRKQLSILLDMEWWLAHIFLADSQTPIFEDKNIIREGYCYISKYSLAISVIDDIRGTVSDKLGRLIVRSVSSCIITRL